MSYLLGSPWDSMSWSLFPPRDYDRQAMYVQCLAVCLAVAVVVVAALVTHLMRVTKMLERSMATRDVLPAAPPAVTQMLGTSTSTREVLLADLMAELPDTPTCLTRRPRSAAREATWPPVSATSSPEAPPAAAAPAAAAGVPPTAVQLEGGGQPAPTRCTTHNFQGRGSNGLYRRRTCFTCGLIERQSVQHPQEWVVVQEVAPLAD